jgi:hypothetical protein
MALPHRPCRLPVACAAPLCVVRTRLVGKLWPIGRNVTEITLAILYTESILDILIELVVSFAIGLSYCNIWRKLIHRVEINLFKQGHDAMNTPTKHAATIPHPRPTLRNRVHCIYLPAPLQCATDCPMSNVAKERLQ